MRFATKGAGTQSILNIQTYNGSTTSYAGSGQGFYLWGAQYEALSFASSYIPTTTGTASRSADAFTIIVFGPFILIGIMLFFLFRAQSKETKKRQKMLEEIQTGDKVIVGGGIHGVIANVKESSFIVKIADNVKVEVNKAGVAAVINNKEDKKENKKNE